jgi:carboxylesterase
MDASETAPFRLDPPGGQKPRGAVLLLHGFTGSPWEVRPLGEALAARGYHVRAPQLPGHGSTPEAMLYVTHLDWEREAQQGLDGLQGYDRLFIAGLSMGALLALLLAARFPERVGAVALLAPALKLQSRGARVLEVLKVVRRHPFDSLWVKKAGSDIEDDEVRARAPLLPRYPAARLRDVFALQRLAPAAAARVSCPALVVVAEQDHVIDVAAARALPRAMHNATLVTLQRGFHQVARDTDRARTAAEVGGFFDRA